jgi:hypothetical protein
MALPHQEPGALAPFPTLAASARAAKQHRQSAGLWAGVGVGCLNLLFLSTIFAKSRPALAKDGDDLCSIGQSPS